MRKLFISTLYILLSIGIVGAQSSSCPVQFEQVMMQTDIACAGIERNEACYGNIIVNIVPFDDDDELNFDGPGDRASIELIRNLSLSSLDSTSGEWGVAVLRLLANLDPSQADDVTLLLLGDTDMESATDVITTQEIVTNTVANIRRSASTDSRVVWSVPADTELNAIGRVEDETWVQVYDSQINVAGWVSVDLLDDFDFGALPIVEPTEPYFGAMQAFYLSSGDGESACRDVPNNGLLIQTPEGAGRVTFWINEITVDFLSPTGNTAFIQADDDKMAIDVLEGSTYVGNETEGYVAVAGSVVDVSLSDNDIEIPAPSESRFSNVRSNVLYRNIQVPQPASVSTIASTNNLNETQYEEVATYGVVLTVSQPHTKP